MRKLEEKIAVITGGSSGIGFATAKQFVAEGAYVFITGRNRKKLDAAVEAIGPNACAVQGDIASLGDLDTLYRMVEKCKGRIDILFANAGAGMSAGLGDITEEHVQHMLETNIKGTLFTVQKALPFIPDGGSIILGGSIAGNVALPTVSVYSATKAAIRALVRPWVIELAPRKIRVNVISPGTIKTPFIDQLAPASKEAISQAINIPSGRLGNAGEVAKAVAFLASADASYINGIELHVDGGATRL